MDKRDVALQMTCPTVMVPRFSALPPADRAGERFLIAANGVFLEVTRAWARFVRKVGEINAPVPYGECHETDEWKAPELPASLLVEFQRLASATPEVEIGAGIVWNQHSNQYRLLPVETLAASGSHLKYRPPVLSDGDHLIVDCHSHARFQAFFSKTDNDDDRWSVKIAYVVGNCERAAVSTATRLCLKGIFENIALD
jgi:PRTRC genetic system protein A